MSINAVSWWMTLGVAVAMASIFLGCVVVWLRLPEGTEDEENDRDSMDAVDSQSIANNDMATFVEAR